MSNSAPTSEPPAQSGRLSYGLQGSVPESQNPFATWISRALAILIDGLVAAAMFLVFLIPSILFFVYSVQFYEDEFGELKFVVTNLGLFLAGVAVLIVGFLVNLGFVFWNNIYRVAKTGAGIGKKVMGIAVVRQDNGQFLSVGMSFLRYLMYVLLTSVCFINYFWPLIDGQRRAWHDMVVETYVVKR